jgi:NAD-dependent dihydropyrimidine dehydrogenase PreA subunit
MVNGQPAFSCKKVAEEGMRIAPHPKFEIIKDLIVDFDKQKERAEGSTASVKITVDPQKCDGCRDCVLICPAKVYEIQKRDGRGVSVPVDVAACCGLTCIQCAIYCKNSAIKVEALRGEK